MREALCLLPGILCDGFVWEPQRAFFSPTHDVIVPDYSACDSIEAMARTALDCLPERFSLAGHSMGGRVALEILRTAPERVARLALLDTGVHGPTPEELPGRRALVVLGYEKGMEAVAQRFIVPTLHPDRMSDKALVASLVEMVCRFSPEKFGGEIRAMIHRPDAAPVLPCIACPTFVLCGRQDKYSPFARHEQIAEQISGARLVAIEDCGHMSTIERPAEVNSTLADWLVTA